MRSTVLCPVQSNHFSLECTEAPSPSTCSGLVSPQHHLRLPTQRDRIGAPSSMSVNACTGPSALVGAVNHHVLFLAPSCSGILSAPSTPFSHVTVQFQHLATGLSRLSAVSLLCYTSPALDSGVEQGHPGHTGLCSLSTERACLNLDSF